MDQPSLTSPFFTPIFLKLSYRVTFLRLLSSQIKLVDGLLKSPRVLRQTSDLVGTCYDLIAQQMPLDHLDDVFLFYIDKF